MSAAGENFSVSGRYYAVSQRLRSHNPSKKISPAAGFFSLRPSATEKDFRVPDLRGNSSLARGDRSNLYNYIKVS